MTDNALYDINERVTALEQLTAARVKPAPYPGLVELRNWGPKISVNTGRAGVAYNGILNTDSITLSPTGLQIYRITSADDYITVPRGPIIDNLAGINGFSFEMFFLYNGVSSDSNAGLFFLKLPCGFWYTSDIGIFSTASWQLGWDEIYITWDDTDGPQLQIGTWYDIQLSWPGPIASNTPSLYLNGTEIPLHSGGQGHGDFDDSLFDLGFFSTLPGNDSQATIYADVGVVRWTSEASSIGRFAANRAFDIALVTG